MRYAPSSLFGLLLVLAFGVVFAVQSFSSECLCEGLPGGECTVCNSQHALVTEGSMPALNPAASLEYQHFVAAWEAEHTLRHREWIELYDSFLDDGPSDEARRAFMQQMERSHREFHEAFSARAASYRARLQTQ